MNKKMWGGRFGKKTLPAFEFFSSSLADDYLLAPYDILASIAHCRMLGRRRIISPTARRRILRGLKAIERSLPKHRDARYA